MPSEEEIDANEFALPADSPEPSESEGGGEVTNRETATFPHNNQGEGVPLPNQPFPLPPHAAMIPPTPGHGVGGQQHQGLFPRGEQRPRARSPTLGEVQRNLQLGTLAPPATPTPPHGTLAARAGGFAPDSLNSTFINAELNMQCASNASQATRTEFQDAVLATDSLVSGMFVFLRGNRLPVITYFHSPAKFYHLTAAQDLKGKAIAFVGDRTSPMMQPTPVLLAPKKTWDWKKVTFVDDRIKMSEFYNQAANANKFWAPEETATPTEKEFPPVLIIPMSMVAWITEKKRTVNDLRKEFERRATAGTTDGGIVNWEFHIQWTVAASQSDGSNEGKITYQPLVSLETERGFKEWCVSRVDRTLGQWQTPSVHGGRPRGEMDAQSISSVIQATMASTITGLATIQSQNASTRLPSAARTTRKGKLPDPYDKWQIAALMAFCGVNSVKSLPPIWKAFQTTTSVETHKKSLNSAMEKWGNAYGIQLELNYTLMTKWMEGIVKMEFGTGGGTAAYSTAGKAISMLAFLPYTADEKQVLLAQEEAERKTEGTRTVDDQRKIDGKGPRLPAATYEKLRRNWGTYLAFLMVLFGDKSDIVIKLHEGYEILDSREVQAREAFFTTSICRQLTWVIIDDARYFFHQSKSPSFFRQTAPLRYPRSLLEDIFSDIRWQKEPNRQCFPAAWRTPSPMAPAAQPQGWQTGTNAAQQQHAALIAQYKRQLAEAQQQLAQCRNAGGVLDSPGKVPSGGGYEAPPGRVPFDINKIHVEFREMMRIYHGLFEGRILFTKIVAAANINQEALPKIATHMKGERSTICWSALLGQCNNQSCDRAHIPPDEIDPKWAQKAVAQLTAGVNWVVANVTPNARSPTRKRKGSRGGGRRE